jgi:hypothetical protein
MPPVSQPLGRRDSTAAKTKATGMDWTPIILMALAAGGIALTLMPPRAPRMRSREDIRAEWKRERRHWAGAPDLREGDE